MGLLVDDLLLLARLDQQRPMEKAPVDVGSVAARRRRGRPRRRPRAPRSHVEAPGARPSMVVTGDAVRLRQVITNLLDNALAYSPDGSPVTVTVAAVDHDGPTRPSPSR